MFFLTVQLEWNWGFDYFWLPSDAYAVRLGFLSIFLTKDSFTSWTLREEYCPECKTAVPIKTVIAKVDYTFDTPAKTARGVRQVSPGTRTIKMSTQIEICRKCDTQVQTEVDTQIHNMNCQKAYQQLLKQAR